MGVGVQRAGTSWWFSLLESHPQVRRLASSAAKELHWFDRFWDGRMTDEDVRRYHDHFRRPAGSVAGEWTPRYLYDPWVPPLLARAAPDARVLVMLRDPVERFRSGLTHAAERGRAIDADVVNDAVQRGRYGAQLEHLLRSIPAERVLVLQFERCRQEPAAMLRRTEEFLGLEPGLVTVALERPRNEAKGAKVDVDPALLGQLADGYAADLRLLRELVPDLDPALWPTFRSLS